MPDFDVVVLGGGTSGLLIATAVAQAGRSAVLVEAGLVGGESPYLACLPSKSMLYSARRGETWEHAIARRDEVARRLDDSAAAAQLAEAGVTLIRGIGRVSRPGVVEVSRIKAPDAAAHPVPANAAGSHPPRAAVGAAHASVGAAHAAGPAHPAQAVGPALPHPAGTAVGAVPEETAQAPGGAAGPHRERGPRATAVLGYTDLVIATGSEPIAPPIEGLTEVPAWTSAQALSSPDLPRRLIVLGAGQIGCELAQLYAAFGSQVTLVEAEPRVLPSEAPFVGEILADALRRTGADVRLGSAAVKAETLGSGLALALADGTRLEADRVLLATGRRPRLSGLGLDSLGITTSAAGALHIDETCQVIPTGSLASRPEKQDTGRIWGAGDVTGVAPYTHAARYQAGIVSGNILGGGRRADYRAIPRVVATTPSVCCVGLSPRQAGAAGITIAAAGLDLAETARATVEDDERGRVELYADAAGMLVGAAAIGPQAEEWMGEVALAIRARLPLTMLADLVHPYPAYGEAIEAPLRELADGTSGGGHG